MIFIIESILPALLIVSGLSIMSIIIAYKKVNLESNLMLICSFIIIIFGLCFEYAVFEKFNIVKKWYPKTNLPLELNSKTESDLKFNKQKSILKDVDETKKVIKKHNKSLENFEKSFK